MLVADESRNACGGGEQNMNQKVAPEGTPPTVAPLRKRKPDGSLYARPDEVEVSLASLVRLPTRELVERSRIMDPEDPDYLRSECVLYFVRRLDFGDEAFRDLFEVLRQRVLRAVPVAARRVAGAGQLGEKTGEQEIQERVLQKIQEMLCEERKGECDGRLDCFECRFNFALARLRSTARKQVWRDESRYESTDFAENANMLSKESELSLRAMRDALSDRGLDFLYRSKLHAAINALPLVLRRVVELTFLEVPDGPKGGNANSICNLVGCYEKTVYNRRKRAFDALRDALKKEEDE